MKKGFLCVLIFPLLIGCGNNISTDNNSNNTFKTNNVTIYSLNDSHGDLLRDIDLDSNGFDSISNLIKNDSKKDKNTTSINICLGDMFQGQYVSEFTKGLPVIDALNYLNCEAFVIGNHEFDWELEYLHRYKDGDLSNGELNCDFLGANIIEKSTNKIPSWIKPYTVIEKDNHKIGIIGFMGEGIENTIAPHKADNYDIVETLPLYKKYSKELKEIHNCDLIIAAVHDYSDKYKEFVNTEIPPHTIFGAHTHKMELEYLKNDKLIYDIPFIQAGCDNEAVSKITYSFNNDNKVEAITAKHLLNSDPDSIIDNKLKTMIESNYEEAFKKSNEIIKENLDPMSKVEWAKFVAKALSESDDNVDIGSLNYTSIRHGTDHTTSKTLYVKQMRRIVPYENTIYQLKIKKDVLDEFMKTNTTNYFEIKHKDTPNDFYIINIVDFVYNLPSESHIWKQGEIINTLDLKIRDYVINYIKNLDN